MKSLSFFILLLTTNFVFAQYSDINPDSYKSRSSASNKSTVLKYYNPLLDNYDISFVALDLNVTDQSVNVSGNALINATVVSDIMDTLIFDFKNNLIIDSVMINGIKKSVSHSNNEILYIFNPSITKGDEITAQIFYKGTPSGGGVTTEYSSSWGKNATWTLSESFHAYEWWPCKQVLSDKIDSVYLNFTCHNNCKVGSNGLLTNVTSIAGDKSRYEWKCYYPINYYLISYAVSEYQDYSLYAYPENNNPILVQNFIYNTTECLEYYKSQIDETANFIELFSNKFCLYPFANEKYGHCLTELGGGMEHQTMTTLGGFGYNLVSHELAHQWFGDYVTCASWQDIWINEGFASYSEYIALENLASYNDAQNWMVTAHDYAFNEPNGSVYIPFEDASDENRIFNYGLSYKKGASIIHTIRHEINNDELFYATLNNFLTHYKNSVATGDDFKNVLENITSIDFDLFFEQWYYGKGFPSFYVRYSQENDTLQMNVTQNTSSTSTPLFNMFVDYKIKYSSGDTLIRLFQEEKTQIYKIPIKKTVTGIVIDPDNWILNGASTAVSIDTVEPQLSFELFPIPADDNLNIKLNNTFGQVTRSVQIYDIKGSLLIHLQTNKTFIPVDISNLNTGIYFLKISSNKNSKSQRFIKL
ncbi:MAG: hypothetical protein A2041_01075 [Bacteroidetes bacterium GWA2_31_9b]|nr:MAG: hypothetical protein A2041_01075 [Bacteroidetes bacterium GWA2_31_9b]